EQVHTHYTHAQQTLESLQAERAAAAQAMGEELDRLHAAALHSEQERVGLRTDVEKLRDRLDGAATTHASVVSRLEADAADLQQQVTVLHTARATLQERLNRAEQAVTAHSEQRQSETQRVAALTVQCAQLEQALTASEERRAALDGEVADAHATLEALRQESA